MAGVILCQPVLGLLTDIFFNVLNSALGSIFFLFYLYLIEGIVYFSINIK
jgi:hypothetical protein